MANKNIWAPIWVTQDMCIWEGRVEVSLLLVTAKTTDCTVTMRNGRDSSGSIVAIVKAKGGDSQPVSFPEEFTLENGLYLSLSDDTLGVLVIFRPISEISA